MNNQIKRQGRLLMGMVLDRPGDIEGAVSMLKNQFAERLLMLSKDTVSIDNSQIVTGINNAINIIEGIIDGIGKYPVDYEIIEKICDGIIGQLTSIIEITAPLEQD